MWIVRGLEQLCRSFTFLCTQIFWQYPTCNIYSYLYFNFLKKEK